MGSGVFSVGLASQRSPAENVASLCHLKRPEKRLPTPSLTLDFRIVILLLVIQIWKFTINVNVYFNERSLNNATAVLIVGVAKFPLKT